MTTCASKSANYQIVGTAESHAMGRVCSLHLAENVAEAPPMRPVAAEPGRSCSELFDGSENGRGDFELVPASDARTCAARIRGAEKPPSK
jgi:hypothetical protein